MSAMQHETFLKHLEDFPKISLKHLGKTPEIPLKLPSNTLKTYLKQFETFFDHPLEINKGAL